VSRKKKQTRGNPRPQPPAIHVTQLVEHQGETFHETVSSPVCDFCFDQGPTWDYPCERFVIPELDFGSDEGWSACDTCSALVEAGDVEGIVERGLMVFGQPERREALIKITEGFLAHRTGERIPFG
jgi:hypothetical protein